MYYTVEIKPSILVDVEAESVEEALSIASQRYESGDIDPEILLTSPYEVAPYEG